MASSKTIPPVPDETTLLLPSKNDGGRSIWRRWYDAVVHVENRILFVGFLITLSFSFTQVPLFYAFHIMECDTFYDSHPAYQGPGDRCSRDEIAAGTARQFSLLGISTTFCGTLNLFVTGLLVRKLGPRSALLSQTFIPALRVAAQILGIVAGKRTGIVMIQCTQLITIVGGPLGYTLVANIIAGELVEASRRTVVFGKLQGTVMLGQGIGYLVGGMLGDIDLRAPFVVAFSSFLLAGVFARLTLPYIDPSTMNDGKKQPARTGVTGFLAPLKILAPRRIMLANGKVTKHYGILFLCAGIFLGVLATGYTAILVQMYATAAFDFSQGDNGYLMAEFAFTRSWFLIFIFPHIIGYGRKWFSRSTRHQEEQPQPTDDESSQHIPTDPRELDSSVGEQSVMESAESPSPSQNKDRTVYIFDLVFLRWSLVVDGLLTTLTAFCTQRWHIYLAAFFLPFGSGSAPAAKGIITEMCSDGQRADALNAVTLVENMARLATLGLFGFVFSSLAEVGKAYATFFCNAAIAVLGWLVLLFSHFPPLGSHVMEEEEVEEEEEVGEE